MIMPSPMPPSLATLPASGRPHAKPRTQPAPSPTQAQTGRSDQRPMATPIIAQSRRAARTFLFPWASLARMSTLEPVSDVPAPPSRGITLRERPVTGSHHTGPRRCWVTGPADSPGPWPGLVLDRRRNAGLWGKDLSCMPSPPPATSPCSSSGSEAISTN